MGESAHVPRRPRDRAPTLPLWLPPTRPQGATLHTLQQQLTEFFADLRRPVLGEMFVQDYAALHPALAAKLTQPFTELVGRQAVINMIGILPLGRAVSIAELETVDGDTSDGARPVLTDHACSWLAYESDSPGAQVAALLARLVLKEPATESVMSLHARLQRACTAPFTTWNFDYGGMARVARLLAAAEGRHEIVVTQLAEAALLLMSRQAWDAVAKIFPDGTPEWGRLSDAYKSLRGRVLRQDPLAHDRLLSAGVFSRDALLPLPPSGRIADLRLPGVGLGFAWPGARAESTVGPLESSPLHLDDSALLTHVLLPGLKRWGVVIPWREPSVRSGLLRQVVGRTPSDGGWPKLIRAMIDRYGFESDISQAGYSVEEIVAFACGSHGVAPAARQSSPAAGTPARVQLEEDQSAVRENAAETRAPAGEQVAVARRTYVEILASLRAQGVHGHDDVLKEISLLADERLAGQGGARLLLIGPPGTGKTRILSSLAKATGRAFLQVDASSISEHGWSGTTLSDVAAMVYRAAGNDLYRAEHAVIALDELCKAAAWTPLPGAESHSRGTRDASQHYVASVRAGRQAALLALLDNGNSVITFSPTPNTPPLQLRTRHCLVVCAGAFRGLAMAGADPTDSELEAYGIIPELVARLTSRLVLSPLTAVELERLWTHGPDAVVPAQAMARALGYDLSVAPEAVRLVARATAAGAGGLTPRTGGALLQSVARRILLAALDDPARAYRHLHLGPDEVLQAIRAAS